MRLLFLPLLLVQGEQFSNHELDHFEYRELEDTIQKSSQDHRHYLGLELGNNLHVLLVSDPRTSKAEVALAVGTGSNDDPDDIPGLSNLCERMLLQGNDKYPSPTDFPDFLASTGGTTEGTTEGEFTIFYFNLENFGLAEGLDRFAYYFIKPEFDESIIKQVVDGIQVEYRLKRHDSPYTQLALHAANSTNQLASTATLTENERGLRARLNAHFNKHYSSNIMNVVISGNDDIETLKKMAVPILSKIPNKHPLPTNLASPFTKDMANDIIIKPTGNSVALAIQFILGPMPYPYYQTTIAFIESFFNAYGKGSLNDLLFSNEIVTSATTKVAERHRKYSVYSFGFHELMPHYNKEEVIRILFAYIDAIRTQGITKENYQHFLNNFKALPPTRWVARGDPPSDYIYSLAVRLQQGATLSTVLGPYEQDPPFDREQLLKAIDQFNPSSFIVFENKNFSGKYRTEPYSGIEYQATKFNQTYLDSFAAITAEDYSIRLPKLPSFQSLPRPVDDTFEKEVKLLANDSFGYVLSVNEWQNIDPSLNLEFVLDSSPRLLPYFDILQEMLKLSIQDSSHYSLNSWSNSISFESQGDQATLMQLTPSFVRALKHLKVTTETFNQGKQKYLKALNESYVEDDDSFPFKGIGNLLNPYHRNYQQMLEQANAVTPSSFKVFFNTYLNTPRVNIIGSGKISAENLLRIRKQTKAILELDSSKFPPPRRLRLILKGNFVYVFKHQEPLSETYYHLAMYDPEDSNSYAMTYLTEALIRTRIRQRLCDLEKLGTDARMDLDEYGGITGYIRSEQSPVYVESRVEAFLESFVYEMKDFPESKLHSMTTSLAKLSNQISARQLIPEHVTIEWDPISNYIAKEKRAKEAAKILPTLTKSAYIQFLESRLLKSSPDRQKISVHLNPTHPTATRFNYTLAECGELIQDTNQWHQSAFVLTPNY